jgi:hypothetical protein
MPGICSLMLVVSIVWRYCSTNALISCHNAGQKAVFLTFASTAAPTKLGQTLSISFETIIFIIVFGVLMMGSCGGAAAYGKT